MIKNANKITGMAVLSLSLSLTLTACGSSTPKAQTSSETSKIQTTYGDPTADTTISQSASSKEDKREVIQDLKPVHDDRITNIITVLDKISKEKANDNIVYSPISLNTALDVYKDLIDNEELKSDIKDYIGSRDYTAYKYDNTDIYKSVNAIWIDKNKDYNLDKLDQLIVKEVNMADPASIEEKNAFVSENTNGFIDSTPSKFDANTVADIMNVLYFKDKWEGGELKTSSSYKEFRNSDGTVTDLDHMLTQKGSHYFVGNKSEAFPLSYEHGMQLWIVLPDEEDFTISELTEDIIRYATNPEACIVPGKDEKTKIEAHLAFPEFETKFETDFSGTIVPTLTSAPFSKSIYTPTDMGKPYKMSIAQVAKIKVDKEGTEAAAVTEVIKLAAVLPSESEEHYIICDRPFIYFIYDTANDDIAFIGVVQKL